MTPEGPGWGERPCDGKHGDVQEQTMMEQVLAAENVRTAWRRVKANAGAPGIDGMSVDAFPDFVREHWPRIRSALMTGGRRQLHLPTDDNYTYPLKA